MVWCRKEELYNTFYFIRIVFKLWFDVEKKNYTTEIPIAYNGRKLWFDVEKKNYTTGIREFHGGNRLWFDVEKKNYTTIRNHYQLHE